MRRREELRKVRSASRVEIHGAGPGAAGYFCSTRGQSAPPKHSSRGYALHTLEDMYVYMYPLE